MHKHIDLIFYDILVELYGKDFAKEEIEFEISLWTEKRVTPYKIAWGLGFICDKRRETKTLEKALQENVKITVG